LRFEDIVMIDKVPADSVLVGYLRDIHADSAYSREGCLDISGFAAKNQWDTNVTTRAIADLEKAGLVRPASEMWRGIPGLMRLTDEGTRLVGLRDGRSG
jgi:hypothetical protein